jgi:hypothetical protein
MTKIPKIFLTISIIAFASSFTEAGASIGWGILRPVGAVAFIAFFITNLLAKEMALYEQEERAKLRQLEDFGKKSLRSVVSTRDARSSARLEPAAAN